ncbi:MAG: DUF1003 domain-containing protein [Chitinophagaceae bacterium]|nr:MAG: DUF1003 domain-containing protein [Chitinophagaceae bacterium]
MANADASRLFNDQQLYEERLKQIVQKSIEEEDSIMDDLHKPSKEKLTVGQHIADKVAAFGGSWKFIIIFCSILVVWICFNVMALQTMRFDPYPFILMNLVLSCLAALQAPIIMMSQNRVEEKDRKESENDYMINLKAEMQIRSLHEKMDLLEEQQIKTLFDTQAKQFELLAAINKKLDHIIANK